jgi:hypothetical protein
VVDPFDPDPEEFADPFGPGGPAGPLVDVDVFAAEELLVAFPGPGVACPIAGPAIAETRTRARSTPTPRSRVLVELIGSPRRRARSTR